MMNAMRLMQDLGVFVIEGAIQNLHSQCDLDLLISGTWLAVMRDTRPRI